MLNAPGFEPTTQTSDGEDARELHHPPDEHLHAEQRVAHPRSQQGQSKHQQRRIGKQRVALGNMARVTANDQPLPQGEDEQHGGQQ